MIGCASIPMRHNGVTSGDAAASIWRQLSATHMAPIQYQVQPRLPLPVERLDGGLDVEPPALIKGYLRLGAKVLGAAGLGSGLQHRRPADADAHRRPAGALPEAFPGRTDAASWAAEM